VSAPADPYLDDRLPLRPGDAVAAILVLPDGRYMLQHRDRQTGIFFPDHWGCFGGAVDAGDADRLAALRRELREELGLSLGRDAFVYFSDFTFDLSFCGVGAIYRTFYEIRLGDSQVAGLSLAEGSEFRPFTAREALGGLRLTPYDAFALWLHANRARIGVSA
jgi:8-oxo-dGTP pyrophosphatase MutT (NUDIX family)